MFVINPYIYTAPAGPSPLTSSDFTTSNADGGTVTWSGTEATITNPNNSKSVFAKCTTTYNSDIIYAQANITWTNLAASGNLGGMYISSQDLVTSSQMFLQNYHILMGDRNTVGANIRNWIRTTSNVYSDESSIAKANDFKITYTVSDNTIRFYYWSGSAWTQIGPTQTYDIRQSGVLKLYIANVNVGDTHSFIFDNIYFGSTVTDYTTQYPS